MEEAIVSASKIRFTMYLDESGDDLLYSEEDYTENLNLESHCTLVGVIVADNAKDLLSKSLRQLKNDIWMSKEVIFHSVDIRNKRGPFAVFHYKPDLYEQFKLRMNEITTKINPSIICSSLNKYLWVKKYPRKLYFGDDPYCQAFVYLLERYGHFLNSQKGSDISGKIVVEQRENKKNRLLQEEYLYFKEKGTQYVKGPFPRLANKIEFKKKKMNLPGLQLGDYICYPFYVNHKNPAAKNEHYSFLEQFIYPGDKNKYGHKKWPV